MNRFLALPGVSLGACVVFFAILTGHKNTNLVANLHRYFTISITEFRCRYVTFRLKTDINEDRILIHAHYSSGRRLSIMFPGIGWGY